MLKEEIFGPILPIVNIKDAYDAIKYIDANEKPLAMYIFSNKKSDVDLILKNTSSGNCKILIYTGSYIFLIPLFFPVVCFLEKPTLLF